MCVHVLIECKCVNMCDTHATVVCVQYICSMRARMQICMIIGMLVQ
jgi:hypothetical protein